MKYKIFILEDHPIMRRGYRTLINGEMDIEVCGEAETAAEALDKIPQVDPDLVIADISLEGTNGIEFVKRLQTEKPGLDVLIVSMHEESLYAERALQAGAVGYVMKKEADNSVLTAIRRVQGGRYYVSERMQDKIMLLFAGHTSPKELAEKTPSITQLSDRELEVFELHGRGLTTLEMAEWMRISPKTIATYRGRIKTKLAIETMPELVRRAVLWIENEKRSANGTDRRTKE
jgi:DNA-binding NarL/FixJ family response regulator